MKIPKSFQLAGQTINVYMVENITKQTEDVDGMAFYPECKIEIKNNKSTNDYKEYVFYHELMHHIFNQIGDVELRTNEKLVSQIATFLHQAIKSSIY